ncbi:hypothetical protein FHG87_017571 [Trinorchestia longiramus]|nr:hypothetical protein FHG87_017571 [Trinorchestia longiramus]
MSPMLNRDIRVRCPLCNTKTQIIHCVECLSSGKFYHSQDGEEGERYIDKCVNVFRIRGRMKLLEQDILQLTEEKQRESLLMLQITEQKRKNECLRNTTYEIRNKVALLQKKCQRVDSLIEHKGRVNQRYKSSMLPAQEILNSTKTKAALHCKELKDLSIRLQAQSSALTDDLLRYIFPLEYLGERVSGDGGGHALQLMLQAPEGSMWSIDDAYSFPLYSVSRLLIPGSGSLLNFLSKEVQVTDEVQYVECPDWTVSGDRQSCSVINITAALSHVTLLTNIIACLMHVVLPHHLSHAEFNDHDLTEDVMNYLVTKLNINVVVLCVAVGVPPGRLNPLSCTLKNLTLAVSELSRAEVGKPITLSDTVYQELRSGARALTSLRSYSRCKNFLPYLNSGLHENGEHILNDYHIVSSVDLDNST